MAAFLVMAGLLAIAACTSTSSSNGGSTTGTRSKSTSSTSNTSIVRSGNVLDDLGRNPSDLDESDLEVQSAQGALLTRSSEGGVDLVATESYIEAALTHLNTIWTNWFLDNGFAEPDVYYNIIMPEDGMVSSACNFSINASHPNAYFCPTDIKTISGVTYQGALYFPAVTMANMWQGDMFGKAIEFGRIGDFAAAEIVGHEFGHSVANELSLQTNTPQPGNPNNELLADCFSGVWTYALGLDNYLEEGDIDEALNAVYTIGDYGFDNPQHHGTPLERQNAFLIGYNGSQANPVGGVPYNCIQAFWQ